MITVRIATIFSLLCFLNSSAQTSVKGNIVLSSEKDKEFIVRNTKVILVVSKARDTVSVNDDLTFTFLNAVPGTGYLYLISPLLPAYTDYKFHIKKGKPTYVSLQYDRFTQSQVRPVKTPEEREEALERGLFIARLAFDFMLIFQSFHR